MKVNLYAADAGACCRVRCELPAQASGVECEVRQSLAVLHGGHRIVDRATGSVIAVRRMTSVQPIDADVAVFQRPPHRPTAERIAELHAQGTAVVVDIDDDCGALHPAHPSRRLYEGHADPDVHWRFTAEACAAADLVTAPTEALARRYAPHGRYAVLPNCVPEKCLSWARSSDGRTLGWAGAAPVHPGDLEQTRGAIPEALEGSGWRYLQISVPAGVREGLGFREEIECTPHVRGEDFDLMLGSLDIGIVPLGVTRFNEAKSVLKGISYAARGVAFVASPTGPYRALAEEGVGLLAPPRARSWRSQIRRLMDDSFRDEAAAKAKEVVADRWTYESNGWRWAEAWERAIQIRRGLKVAA